MYTGRKTDILLTFVNYIYIRSRIRHLYLISNPIHLYKLNFELKTLIENRK